MTRGGLGQTYFLFLSFDGQPVVQARWITKYEKQVPYLSVRYTDETEAQVLLVNPANFDDWLNAPLQTTNETVRFRNYNQGRGKRSCHRCVWRFARPLVDNGPHILIFARCRFTGPSFRQCHDGSALVITAPFNSGP